MLGQLALRGVCPHYLRQYACFRSAEQPPTEEWVREVASKRPPTGSDAEEEETDGESDGRSEASTVVAPPRAARKQARPKKGGEAPCFQYVLNEYAAGGDMEEACKAQPGAMWGVDQLPPLMYQLLFSMYAAQRELGLRHYDVKLLNFFLSVPSDAMLPSAPEADAAQAAAASRAAAISWRAAAAAAEALPEGRAILHYGCLGRELRFPISTTEPSVAMLADFGTADIAAETMGAPVGAEHFTTLENSPPDFLLCGAHAAQGYAADAFALGLCWLHLLTGKAPYEELLASLRCPPQLREALHSAWCDEAEADPQHHYRVVRRLVRSDDEDTLFHTVYRCVGQVSAKIHLVIRRSSLSDSAKFTRVRRRSPRSFHAAVRRG